MESATGLQRGAPWIGRVITTVVCLAALCLIVALMGHISSLLGSNYDLPPTWYFVVTALLVVADIAAICYLVFSSVRVLLGKTPPKRLLKATTVVSAVLVLAHAATGCAYSAIPQWDFQDSLFDDLS